MLRVSNMRPLNGCALETRDPQGRMWCTPLARSGAVAAGPASPPDHPQCPARLTPPSLTVPAYCHCRPHLWLSWTTVTVVSADYDYHPT